MGEFVAFAIVLAAVIVVVCVLAMLKRHNSATLADANRCDPFVRVIVRVPQSDLGRVATEFQALSVMKKPGTIEFYETPDRIIRIVVD